MKNQGKLNTANQVRPPLPKKKRVDGQGNDLRRLWLKDGNTTMLITKDLTENGCKVIINSINTAMVKLGKKAFPKYKFLITK